MEYVVIHGPDIYDIIREVNYKLTEGWITIGGVCAHSTGLVKAMLFSKEY